MFETRGRGTPVGRERVQIKDPGLTWGVDDERSPFLAVKVSFRVQSNK